MFQIVKTKMEGMDANVSAIAYEKIKKGRGFVYVHVNQLYKQVKKLGDVIYLKCHYDHCDGSAKLKDGVFTVGVSDNIQYVYFYLFQLIRDIRSSI